jgi:proteasome lid subunit RPN8/RPN11
MFRPHRKRLPGGPRLGDAPNAITRRALENALASARSAYPNEFGGVLRAEPPGVIGELMLVPGGTAGRRHANFHLYMLPADLSVVGTVHSHPSGALHPSDADLRLFRNWGRRHLILGSPFSPGSWRAYDGNGAPISLQVVGEGPPGASAEARLPEYRPRAIHRPERGEPLPDFPSDEP